MLGDRAKTICAATNEEKTQTKRFCLIKLTKYAADERLKKLGYFARSPTRQHVLQNWPRDRESVAKRETMSMTGFKPTLKPYSVPLPLGSQVTPSHSSHHSVGGHSLALHANIAHAPCCLALRHSANPFWPIGKKRLKNRRSLSGPPMQLGREPSAPSPDPRPEAQSLAISHMQTLPLRHCSCRESLSTIWRP